MAVPLATAGSASADTLTPRPVRSPPPGLDPQVPATPAIPATPATPATPAFTLHGLYGSAVACQTAGNTKAQQGQIHEFSCVQQPSGAFALWAR
ncbi:hypothetical protein NKH77_28550 [Streptomyces sp. M19]